MKKKKGGGGNDLADRRKKNTGFRRSKVTCMRKRKGCAESGGRSAVNKIS